MNGLGTTTLPRLAVRTRPAANVMEASAFALRRGSTWALERMEGRSALDRKLVQHADLPVDLTLAGARLNCCSQFTSSTGRAFERML